jgi:hypothetical protein
MKVSVSFYSSIRKIDGSKDRLDFVPMFVARTVPECEKKYFCGVKFST